MVALDPLILLAVARVLSGVQEQSYSPDSKYTGHFFVSIKDDRLSKSPSCQ